MQFKIIPKRIPLVFHNGTNYDYHFIIKELAKVFEGVINCFEENTGKYKTFSVPKTNEVKRLVKIEKKSQKPDLKNYNLLIAQDL